ncbi:MAG: hypothetical protein O3A51_07390 [Verrucomicrobia bacterium]|nr:hypothetical protein [Verrucomicrobiota bacterium]
MFKHRIKIGNALYEKLKVTAAQQGYATTDEFIQHLLEQATQDAAPTDDEALIAKRLKGLGYIE